MVGRLILWPNAQPPMIRIELSCHGAIRGRPDGRRLIM
jgi:hypothetical protein